MSEKIFIQGYGSSGCSAVGDFLKEFSNIYNPVNLEFDIFRSGGGVYELNKVLNICSYMDNSYIHRFKNLIKYLSNNYVWKHYFNSLIEDGFYNVSNSFINSVIDHTITSTYPSFSPSDIITNNIKFNWLLPSRFLDGFYRKINKERFANEIYYIKNDLSKDDLINLSKQYIENLFNLLPSNKIPVVYHPFIIEKSIEDQLQFFSNFKVVIIDRDPRDIFVQFYHYPYECYSVFKNVDYFIHSFKKKRSQKKHNIKILGNKCMSIKYEDFVEHYDDISILIMDFLGLHYDNHIKKFEFFNPDVSYKNIGIYKNFKYQQLIASIEEQLSDYL